MAKTTVKDLAADLNLPVETLLSQLKEAGPLPEHTRRRIKRS